MKTTLLKVSAWLAAAAIVAPSCLSAQTETGPGLDLMSVLQTTLASQPEIEMGRLDIRRAEGDLQSASGSFDYTLFGNTYYQKDDGLLTEYEKALFGYDAEKAETAAFEMGVRRTFRTGLQGELAARSTRIDDQSGLEGYPTVTRNVLEFSVVIPLLRGGTTYVTADEKRIEYERQAARKRYLQITADAVAAATSDYWDYLAAYRNLLIKKESEQRTESFLRNIDRLIKVGERPASDAVQVAAELASKRSERIDAERQLHEFRQRLGLSMGLDSGQAAKLGPPAGEFPHLAGSSCPSLSDEDLLVETARNNRGDYAAAQLDERAIGIELEREMDGLKPRIDLKLAANVEGISEDSTVMDVTTEEETGPGGLILLNGEWPIRNNSARGAVASLRAQQQKLQLQTFDLERTIRSDISVAVSDVCRTLDATNSMNEAVALYNQAVLNEFDKLKIGMSSLADTISAEDKRNSAQEDLITQQSAFAKAIVRLRNATGTLVQMTDETGSIDSNQVTTLEGLTSN